MLWHTALTMYLPSSLCVCGCLLLLLCFNILAHTCTHSGDGEEEAVWWAHFRDPRLDSGHQGRPGQTQLWHRSTERSGQVSIWRLLQSHEVSLQHCGSLSPGQSWGAQLSYVWNVKKCHKFLTSLYFMWSDHLLFWLDTERGKNWQINTA